MAVPQPEVPPLGSRSELEQAKQAFAGAEAPRKIVRSYREAPSSLVRDNVRGWRTGRLDLVLAGNFDPVYRHTITDGASCLGTKWSFGKGDSDCAVAHPNTF